MYLIYFHPKYILALLLLHLQVLVGEHNTADTDVDRRDVMKIRNHPRYKHENADYDFSVLFLNSPLTFSSTIAPVCLPASTQSLYTGQVATVTGWGLTSSDGSQASTLQEAEVTVISNEECNDHYPGKIKRYKYNFKYIYCKIDSLKYLFSFHICAGDSNNIKDSCQGDSGGPLMVLENGK